DALIERLRELRVGGCFWGARPPLSMGCTVVRCPVAGALTLASDAKAMHWADTEALGSGIDPWHLLDHAARVIAPHGDTFAI
ncbi:hypothetical protein, partial [Streptococcus pneumoniae]